MSKLKGKAVGIHPLKPKTTTKQDGAFVGIGSHGPPPPPPNTP